MDGRTLRCSEGDSRTFRAARSRWVSPRSAMCSMPSAIWPHMVMRCATLSGGRRPASATGVDWSQRSWLVARKNVLRSPCSNARTDHCTGSTKRITRSTRLLSQTDPRDALLHAHRAVDSWTLSVINWPSTVSSTLSTAFTFVELS